MEELKERMTKLEDKMDLLLNKKEKEKVPEYQKEMKKHTKKMLNLFEKYQYSRDKRIEKFERVIHDCGLKNTNDNRLKYIEIESYGYVCRLSTIEQFTRRRMISNFLEFHQTGKDKEIYKLIIYSFLKGMNNEDYLKKYKTYTYQKLMYGWYGDLSVDYKTYLENWKPERPKYHDEIGMEFLPSEEKDFNDQKILNDHFKQIFN